ncbi:MAG: membrane lipoprotein lipid attachment site-containing protein [Patescibacteria group bacterium]
MKQIILVFAAVALLAGCSRTADFKIAASNRLPDHINFFVDGKDQGIVPAGMSQEFVVELTYLDNSPTGWGGNRKEAQATCNARNRHTGELSRNLVITCFTDRTTTVEVNEWDFR